MIKTPLCDLLGIEYPIFQGGMAWISDGKLAAAVSNGGGLGIISAMNANAQYVKEQIDLCRGLTDKPFGVNIMLMSPFAEEVAQLVAEEKVPVVTTGAGNPSRYMPLWKEAGVKVVPVVASVSMARLVTKAGATAIIAEGGESGGHVGDLTTMVLVPQVVDATDRCWRPGASATGGALPRPSSWGPWGSRWAPGSWWPRSAASTRITRKKC